MAWRSFFIRIVCSILVIVSGYVGIAETMLHRLNESAVGSSSAIHMQIDHNALYGSAITGDVSFLKYGVAEERRPDIIALGTSRTMQFREEFFQGATFYTLGGLATQ